MIFWFGPRVHEHFQVVAAVVVLVDTDRPHRLHTRSHRALADDREQVVLDAAAIGHTGAGLIADRRILQDPRRGRSCSRSGCRSRCDRRRGSPEVTGRRSRLGRIPLQQSVEHAGSPTPTRSRPASSTRRCRRWRRPGRRRRLRDRARRRGRDVVRGKRGFTSSMRTRIRPKLTWSPGFATSPEANAASAPITSTIFLVRPSAMVDSPAHQNASPGKLPGNEIGLFASGTSPGRNRHNGVPSRHSSTSVPSLSAYQIGYPFWVLIGPTARMSSASPWATAATPTAPATDATASKRRDHRTGSTPRGSTLDKTFHFFRLLNYIGLIGETDR